MFKSVEPLEDACGHEALLTCRVIQERMVSSTVFSAVFAILGAMLSVQLLLDSAMLHERACLGRLAAEAESEMTAGRSPRGQ
eukprot:CAMPEP_0175466500 /NCGR_PEP_ID=MMETSP0095-20121207/70837_1 /TAXON_ID=311494 /ORGANISM="Alexandrium monilatum, Strain CCMP3105" /LENGTH=81 /DNA_ID=CAMNT_0016767845 /DNA_START=42 /DNA_END=287 /DNA_ORIENTATION=-